MTIHYPNGNQNNYPTKSHANSPAIPHVSLYGKRGMSLEEEINDSNAYYLAHEIAVIHKKPTPIQLVKVDYPKRSAAVIKEAYFRRPSTTDYNGVYRGYYLDFDAKETNNKTSFPLKNFHEHQIKHLKACINQGGICFAFLKFTAINVIYLLPATKLFIYWDQQFDGGRKSIPLKNIKQDSFQIKYQLNPIIPYLDAVDKMIAESGK
ncbi:recombinase RecU [Paucilactobacillus hokkaidonensis JCM 18461]|uniref:Holliday junction resolvase RecU n=2 Tax=Paucilactobacillus hokkaidonensis TaxID=1193095 RepID=A0A0A1GXI9_9LACO|nr:Holliday junction resolvase RecU [Paucilactobacillus hokkaidonensis]KRO10623.1 Holliday junction-specific endonuclease [Paucilactobacillus hokkaidonensis]BAP85614.1 recombinase RecU [Paucilactobacillus hokkaidonensis JCM 18461]